MWVLGLEAGHQAFTAMAFSIEPPLWTPFLSQGSLSNLEFINSPTLNCQQAGWVTCLHSLPPPLGLQTARSLRFSPCSWESQLRSSCFHRPDFASWAFLLPSSQFWWMPVSVVASENGTFCIEGLNLDTTEKNRTQKNRTFSKRTLVYHLYFIRYWQRPSDTDKDRAGETTSVVQERTGKWVWLQWPFY